MQIDIRLIPFYEKPFEKAFPRIAALLREHGYTEPLERDVSLYDLVDTLADMTHAPGVPRVVKERMAPHVAGLITLKETARERLLSRRLNALDAALYDLEDAVEELESSL
jgi:hypothetical protein